MMFRLLVFGGVTQLLCVLIVTLKDALMNQNGGRMGLYKTDFKYTNINKQREASISFKHLQINTWF